MKQQAKRPALALQLLLSAALLAAAGELAAQTTTQQIPLRSGWNAVYLEVQPRNADPAAVFGAMPPGLLVEAVWMWNGRAVGPDFIQDVSEALVRQPGWLAWFPSETENFLSTLKSVGGGRAYLMKVSGAAQTWSLTGTPVTAKIEWIPSSLNLTGLYVDPDNQPLFGAYLAASPAHAGRPVYTLDSSGAWRAVNANSERIEPGIAYWFDVQGGSSYQGPISVVVDGLSLEYGQSLTEREVSAVSAGPAGTASLRVLAAPDAVPLRYWKLGTNGATEWPAFPAQHSLAVDAGSSSTARLAIDRTAFSADRITAVLEATTSTGGRWLFPLAASRTNSGASIFEESSQLRRGVVAMDAPVATAGLWVGSVQVDKVNNAQEGVSTPLSTESPFALRLILHVDGGGTVKLLKQVLQMWQNGPNASTPGHYVLVDDLSLAANYQGAALRDGVPVARRVSSIGFDFAGNSLTLGGSFASGSTLSCSIDVPRDLPTNPFRHKYHPDHQNADPATTFDITRTISIALSATDPQSSDPPSDSNMFGAYTETITGLHKNTIHLSGTLRLKRASLVAELNQ